MFCWIMRPEFAACVSGHSIVHAQTEDGTCRGERWWGHRDGPSFASKGLWCAYKETTKCLVFFFPSLDRACPRRVVPLARGFFLGWVALEPSCCPCSVLCLGRCRFKSPGTTIPFGCDCRSPANWLLFVQHDAQELDTHTDRVLLWFIYAPQLPATHAKIDYTRQCIGVGWSFWWGYLCYILQMFLRRVCIFRIRSCARIWSRFA